MFIGVYRTTFVRVCSTSVIEFRRFPDEETDDGGLIYRSATGWWYNQSLFSWADTGRWHTVHTSDETLRRERDWFRIGFEPMFVDFTQSGAWFTFVFLLEVRGYSPNMPLCHQIMRFVHRHGQHPPHSKLSSVACTKFVDDDKRARSTL